MGCRANGMSRKWNVTQIGCLAVKMSRKWDVAQKKEATSTKEELRLVHRK